MIGAILELLLRFAGVYGTTEICKCSKAMVCKQWKWWRWLGVRIFSMIVDWFQIQGDVVEAYTTRK
ncbi:UNVERIFIED_CONTAM: hypothetical protein Slati_2176500 [Sesamum latifolium]|uniref:Secreted protein n=1 Tax=Sesamum latifolium TaxID=2727402 RepID=A0AAW2WSL5_9LAMI